MPIVVSLSAAEVLKTVGCLPESVLVVPGAVTGRGLEVNLAHANVFSTLAGRAGVAYVDVQSWAHNRDLVSRVPAGLDDEPAVVHAHTVLGGVTHTLSGADARFVKAAEAIGLRLDREDAAWAERREQDQMRIAQVVADIEANYPARLIADESWLVTVDQRGRERIARDWAAAEFPDVAGEQRVRGAVLNAVGLATEQRERMVIPARLAAFEEHLDEHAARLTTVPAPLALATTKAAREAHARRYVSDADPLVAPAVVLDRLIAAAIGAMSAG